MNGLEARDLDLRLGGRTLCRGLNVALGAGENWAILGANGSGKTTLLHTLAGLRRPERGTVLIDGSPIDELSPRQRALKLGILLQDYDSGFPSTVIETVLSGRHPHLNRLEWESAADRQLALDTLTDLGLAGLANRALATLSGGERRRVEIAALLVQQAPMLLLDEPTNHLDLRHQADILRRIAARSNRSGHMNVFVLHDVNAAVRRCTHGLLLFDDGNHLAGPIAEMTTRANLERLYSCPLREISAECDRVFVPA
jgi:iron complex transport system ATP-binding protein